MQSLSLLILFQIKFYLQPSVYNDYHGLRQKSMSLNNNISENLTKQQKGVLKKVDCIMEKTKRD